MRALKKQFTHSKMKPVWLRFWRYFDDLWSPNSIGNIPLTKHHPCSSTEETHTGLEWHVLCFPPSYVHIWCFLSRSSFCVIISLHLCLITHLFECSSFILQYSGVPRVWCPVLFVFSTRSTYVFLGCCYIKCVFLNLLRDWDDESQWMMTELGVSHQNIFNASLQLVQTLLAHYWGGCGFVLLH